MSNVQSIGIALPSTNAVVAQLLSPAQRAALDSANGGNLHRSRNGYCTAAAAKSGGPYHQSRTVFSLESEGLLACVEPGDTTCLRITASGREVREALA